MDQPIQLLVYFPFFIIICSQLLQNEVDASILKRILKHFGIDHLKHKHQDGRKIIGGESANILHHPYFVVVLPYPREQDEKDYGICGGVHIKTHWVLTAAHCLYYRFSGSATPHMAFRVKVVWKVLDILQAKAPLGAEGDTTNLMISRDLSVKDDYFRTYPSFSHDIALIKLTGAPPMTSFLALPILEEDHQIYMSLIGKSVKIIGFGYYIERIFKENRTVARTLQQINIEVNPQQVCYDYFPRQHHFDVHHNFCYGRDPFYRPSFGDSGSPVIAKHPDNREVLIGVNVGNHIDQWWWNQYTLEMGPTYAVNVETNLPWIRWHTGINATED